MVGVPGILDGRRRADAGRRAGRTNSPDFFLTIGGFGDESPSLSSGELVNASSFCKIDDSVAEREWEILRASFDSRKWRGFTMGIAITGGGRLVEVSLDEG